MIQSITSLFQDLTISTIILYIFAIYSLFVATYVVLENRSPQSTYSWLMTLMIFPPVGLVLYYFVGRGWRAFSREDKLVQQALGDDVVEDLTQFRARQHQMVAELEQKEVSVARRKLLRLVFRNSNSVLTYQNRLQLLQNATSKYPQLVADIEAAQHSVHMVYYIWHEDPWTQKLKELLIRKAKEGVQVRVLVDAQGSELSRRYMRDLREGGVQFYIYYNYRSIFKLHTISYRNHRKFVIIDGFIGYTGGLNIGEEHLTGGKYFSFWRDTHLRIEGEATQVLQGIFVTSWYNTTQERLTRESIFSELYPLPEEHLAIQITTSGPDSQWEAIRQLYFLMIMAAEERLYIQSPFFIPDTSIAEALKAAALSGVDVKVMCAPRGTAYTLPYWAANTYFAEMVQAGVRIFLYQKGYFHAKTVSIDSAVCSVGTANMDIRSFSINYEVNTVIYDEVIARQLEADFEADLADCAEFTLEEYEQRPLWERLRDSACRLFSPLL